VRVRQVTAKTIFMKKLMRVKQGYGTP